MLVPILAGTIALAQIKQRQKRSPAYQTKKPGSPTSIMDMHKKQKQQALIRKSQGPRTYNNSRKKKKKDKSELR
jgi:hypothetical protein